MTQTTSRRSFLKLAGQVGALGAAAPLGLNLLTATSAAALTDPDDYKALVCIFLYGGNDAYNTLVPYDKASHDAYLAARSNLAVARASLNAGVINPSNARDHGHGRQLAFNPAAAPMKALFDAGNLAVVANCGTLMRPTTLADYRDNRNLPPKLMSHNDQFSIWQTLLAEGAQTGWGGRMADLALANNGANARLSAISVGGSSPFVSGNRVQEMAFGADGPTTLKNVPGIPGFTSTIHNRILGASARSDGLIMSELSDRYDGANLGGRAVESAIAGMPTAITTQVEEGELVPAIYRQLDTVAKVIKVNRTLGMKRQVFFVQMGGFDTHGSLGDAHPILLRQLSDAMQQFNGVITADRSLADKVTTFTASDFGRALTTNGRGSDHGWGGHHFVMGGAVRARHVAGKIPVTKLGGEDDIGQGRLLPAVSLEQYGATIAKWYGVEPSEMRTVFPGLSSFDQTDLGFMAG